MGARGKKRRRKDGTIAGRVTHRVASLPSSLPANLALLFALGLDEREVAWAAEYALMTYDANRREKGKQIGAFGRTGEHVWRVLAITSKESYEYDWKAFITPRRHTAEGIAERAAMSPNTANKALTLLSDHGFVERTRQGRSFFYRPILPDVALEELAERWNSTTDSEPYDLRHRRIGQKLRDALAERTHVAE